MGVHRRKEKKRKVEESYSYGDEDDDYYSRSPSPKRKERRHRTKKRKEKGKGKDKKRRKVRRRRRRDDYSSDYDYDSRSRSPSRRKASGPGVSKAELREFCKFNKLNDEVAERLMDADKEVAALVISQGKNVIDNARNANAVVIQRIRKHEVELGVANRGPPRRRTPPRSTPMGGGEQFKEGDWYCSACDAHNFSKRVDCFKCGRPRDRAKEEGRRDDRPPPQKRSRSRSRSASRGAPDAAKVDAKEGGGD